MTTDKETNSPRHGLSRWKQLIRDAFGGGRSNNSKVTTAKTKRRRRASWSGGEGTMGPTTDTAKSDTFTSRRSLALLFGSLGKGKRHGGRHKAMALSRTLDRQEVIPITTTTTTTNSSTSRPSSQFYVEFPAEESTVTSLSGSTRERPRSPPPSPPPHQHHNGTPVRFKDECTGTSIPSGHITSPPEEDTARDTPSPKQHQKEQSCTAASATPDRTDTPLSQLPKQEQQQQQQQPCTTPNKASTTPDRRDTPLPQQPKEQQTPNKPNATPDRRVITSPESKPQVPPKPLLLQQQNYHPRPPFRPNASVRGVLVLPEAVRQSAAYRVRARLFADPSPTSSPKETMGAGSSTNAKTPIEPVAPYVVQQYGSILAELTHKYRNRQYPVPLNPDSSGQDISDSGDEGEDEDAEKIEDQDTNDKAELHETPLTAQSTVSDSSSSSSGGSSVSVSCTNNALSVTNPALSKCVVADIRNEHTPTPSPELTSQEKRDRKVFLIAQEVMTSERVFVDVLRLLNVDFRKFVREWRRDTGGNRDDEEEGVGQRGGHQDASHTPVLPLHELDKILNYLPQLQNLNEEILSDLEERIADWESRKKISDVIVRKGPFLKLYSAYIREFQNQSDHLDHCCQHYPDFTDALRAFESSERCTKLNLKHYMLKPVQRIPQYRLLLEEYLKYLPDTHPDYVDTQTALAVVANVASHANDTMKQGTNFMKVLALQDRLNSGGGGSSSSNSEYDQGTSSSSSSGGSSRGPRYELLRPGRHLLKEGELLKLCRREMQPRYFILLSDVLLYTSFANSSPNGALRLNYELPLEGMRVETPVAEDFKNEFSVISTSRSFTLQASSAKERDEWLRTLREAIAANALRRSTFQQVNLQEGIMCAPTSFTLGKQAPVWIPDYRVTMCQQCTASFTLTFRRHHCRACGKVVCDHCSANRAPLIYKKNKAARVCDACFEVLQQNYYKEASKNLQSGDRDPHQQDGGDGGHHRDTENLKGQFRRGIREEKRNRVKKKVPDRLMEVCANDISSQMSGYLQIMVRRSWRRGWFVLKDRVLYEYRAPQDVCALYSLPILGYRVEQMNKDREVCEDVDDCLTFQLSHLNQSPLVFQTDSPHLAEKWIQAMKEAVVLN